MRGKRKKSGKEGKKIQCGNITKLHKKIQSVALAHSEDFPTGHAAGTMAPWDNHLEENFIYTLLPVMSHSLLKVSPVSW